MMFRTLKLACLLAAILALTLPMPALAHGHTQAGEYELVIGFHNEPAYQGEPNSLEASMAKAKAGKVVTQIAQKAVELLGASGYSREWLAEKWMRDAKITQIYEGTQQIQRVVIGRRMAGRWPPPEKV